MTRTPRPSRVTPHPYEADESLPADWQGRRVCARCRRLGEPGDPRHPLGQDPPPPLPADVAAAAREHDAAVLGEDPDR